MRFNKNMTRSILLFLAMLPVLLAAQTNKGLQPVSSSSGISGGNTYALVVGISDYQDPAIPDLRFADRDAEAFANFLRSPAGGSLDEDHLQVLTNRDATLGQFAAALDWLMEVSGEGDLVILYFSGHGDVEARRLSQPGYLLGWDAPSRNYMAGGALNVRDLQDIVSTLSVQNKSRVWLITDACRSGKLSGSDINGAQLTGQNLARQYANETKILSCQPNEYSIEGEQWGGGRGAFSYHLLEALYGMADANGDLSVTLKEVGRYLEDHVAEEVAPVSQNPQVLGDPNGHLASVDANLLADLHAGKTNQMAMLSPVDSRGMEDEVLAGVDSTIRLRYELFQKALKDKVLLIPQAGDPASACAEAYYQILAAEPGLARLYSTMRRNYAAALQDDAQQTLNLFLRTNREASPDAGAGERGPRLSIKIFTEKVRTYPRCLERAAELLGKEHYMYATLQARRHFFEGYLLNNADLNDKRDMGLEALEQFRRSLGWQPDQPQVYWQMSIVYGFNLLQPDTAEVYARKAMALHPGWVVPHTDLAYMFTEKYQFYDRARHYLEAASQIDPDAMAVTGGWGIYFLATGDLPRAEEAYKKVIQLDSTVYQAYNNLGLVYQVTRRYDLAEAHFKRAIQLDSTACQTHTNLGVIYMETGRYDQAERQLKKAIQLDTTYAVLRTNLGNVYARTGRFDLAEEQYEQAIRLDSTATFAYHNLGFVYFKTQRYDLAEPLFLKAIQLDPTYVNALVNLGNMYKETLRYTLAEDMYKRIISIDSTYWIGYINLSLLYQTLQRWEESETMTQQAIAFGPQTGDLIAILGNAQTHIPGRLDDARKSLDEALAMDADWPDTYIYLAYWSIQAGQIDLAWGFLEQGLQKGIGNGVMTREEALDGPDLESMRKDPRWQALMETCFPRWKDK